jgi:hypothetical protein
LRDEREAGGTGRQEGYQAPISARSGVVRATVPLDATGIGFDGGRWGELRERPTVRFFLLISRSVD